MIFPQQPASAAQLAPGALALPHGLLYLERAQTLVAADVHFAYEEVIGAALPLWSTEQSVLKLLRTVEETQARELVLLGDVIHGSRMSDGAARTVGGALERLRARCEVTVIAGNHEGRSRGVAVLGETFERVERDGWLLVHGDEPVAAAKIIVGHLHPSIPLGGDHSMPAFLATPQAIVVPALTPYSRGLNVFSQACAVALRPFMQAKHDIAVVACSEEKVYPFGSLAELRALLRGQTPATRARSRLRADSI